MSRRIVRAALTETINAFQEMPSTTDQLHTVAHRFEDIRRANVDHHLELMKAAHQQKVQIICFGELFTAPYFALEKNPMWLPMAEDAENGPTATQLKAAAKQYQMIVVAPLYEQDQDARYNTAIIIDENGQYLGKFRKAHIPYGRNEQGEFAENFYYGRSDATDQGSPHNISQDPLFPVFKTSLGNVGVATCYDRHFPYVMWSLAQQGAELVFNPAITFGEKSERMWELEIEVDAARHNLFIGGSNRKGAEPPWNQPYFGKSFFVGPNGRPKNISDHPNLVVADLDLQALAEPDPSGWNLPRDTRAEWALQPKLKVVVPERA